MIVRHRCEHMKDCINMISHYGPHGVAIEEIIVDEHGAWVTNGEYSTFVYYCPFCGIRLQLPRKEGEQ